MSSLGWLAHELTNKLELRHWLNRFARSINLFSKGESVTDGRATRNTYLQWFKHGAREDLCKQPPGTLLLPAWLSGLANPAPCASSSNQMPWQAAAPPITLRSYGALCDKISELCFHLAATETLDDYVGQSSRRT